jgi:biopolymer transport protein ExbD
MKINLDTVADDAQIQILPLIDVIFCILTFFILAAAMTTRQQGINLNASSPPEAKTGVPQMRQMLVVSIDPLGQTFIDQNPVDRAQLYTLLKQYRERNPEGLLVLNASKDAVYDQVIQVLDVLRAVGGDKVALATIPSPTIMPTPAATTGQFGLPGAAPSLFPSGGVPGLPLVPGQTNPQLPSSNNRFAPPGPTQPSDILPLGGSPSPSVMPNNGTNVTPSGTGNGAPSGTSNGIPATTPDGLPLDEPLLPPGESFGGQPAPKSPAPKAR